MDSSLDIELRRIDRKDLGLLWKWNLNTELGNLSAFTNNKSLAEFEKEFEENIGNHSILDYLIIIRDSKEPIGFCGLKNISWIDRNAEVFMSICDEKYWKNGYGTITLMMLVKIGFFELNLHKIYAKTTGNNDRMLGFAKKWGFQAEGVMKEMHYANNKYHDSYIFSILRKDVAHLLEFGIEQLKHYLFPKIGMGGEKEEEKSRELVEKVVGITTGKLGVEQTSNVS